MINCITPKENSTFCLGQVVLRIDEEVVVNNEVLFSYRPNPIFTSVRPRHTIARYTSSDYDPNIQSAPFQWWNLAHIHW